MQLFQHPINDLYQIYYDMKYITQINLLGFLVFLVSIDGIVLSIVYSPVALGVTAMAILTLIQIVASQLTKEFVLVEKKEMAMMIYLAFWAILAVFNTVLALSVLIYLEELQQNNIGKSQFLQPFMIDSSALSGLDTSWINLTYYFGQAFGIGFYTRAYYRFFFVENIVNIYRFLRRKVKILNQSLISALPIINIGDHLDVLESICPLCLEEYNELQEITRLSCNHYFHRNCIRIWVVRSNACPICRRRVIF